jgi:ParB-like chromosome segregation protein Spo0J
MPAADLKVEKVSIASLQTDPENVRRHGDRNIDAIKASLTRFGQQHPIVVDSKGVVRVGNGRLEAMRQLGWTECYVIKTNLTDAELDAYAVADNRTSELASWDLDGLDVLLKDLSEGGIDLKDIGFTEGDISAMLGPAEWKKDPSAGGDPEKPEKSYAEKISVTVTDMTVRSAVTEAIKSLIEREGWTEVAHVR